MKLISLNIWAGREYDNLLKYISSNKDTDIFCFQEVFDTTTDVTTLQKYYRADILSRIKEILPEYNAHFAVAQEMVEFDQPADYPIAWGIAMFVKNDVDVLKNDISFIYREKNTKEECNSTIPRNIQSVTFKKNNIKYNVAHFHGAWLRDQGKVDTSERIEQSEKVNKHLSNFQGKTILCGDFNLLPDTKSLEMLEENRVNLIKKYDITSTRSKLYRKYETGSLYADYMIVSSDVNVIDFKVPYVEASDHLPLELEFD